jgi:hypothetical protein
MVRGTLGEKAAAWAAAEPSVEALVLIGSRMRAASDAVWAADAQSDWDFLVISSRPEMFATSAWLKKLGAKPVAYAVRTAQLGGVPKIAAVFADTEADFVIQPVPILRQAQEALARGDHHRPGPVRSALQDLAAVIRPGWKFLKGAETWEPLYRKAVAAVPDRRLDTAEAKALADGFVCDAVWTRRKIDRGELLAAQRMLHRALAETNFRLLHELRLRRRGRSFPEARRIERIARAAELAAVTVTATPGAKSLLAAVGKSSATLRTLMRALAPDWRWPLA